ncbi:hypothetical protein B5G50_21455 [Brevibacillus brevis]|uniref:hypothetical protein n=1 Tax=Brevibacillus brevis TaxID=1393 RepID=UPI000B3889A9|nr:hypothetical protein [Brevibacillus brevis]OUQ86502.1 hypothetical protein B5G50_21455 [Brevibacillus brevis]
MNLYFLYYADMHERSVGQVFTHEKPYTEKEFNEIVAKLKEIHGDYEFKIGEYLVNEYGFTRPEIIRCNTADLK